MEHPLIRFGHAALAGVIPGKLIGFSPVPSDDESAILNTITHGGAVKGCLQDDTEVFRRAEALAKVGKQITIWEHKVDVSAKVVTTIEQQYIEKSEAWYSFPDGSGNFPADQYNCATFLLHLGVPIPTPDGRMQILIAAMLRKGAKTWVS